GADWEHADAFEKARQQNTYQSQSYGGQSYQGGDPFGGFSGSADFGGNDFSDFFSSMFGGGSGSGRRQTQFRGADLKAELHLNFRKAAETHKQSLTINGKTIRITVPAGVSNGQEIRLKGYGSPGVNNGPNGDLYITFVIADDPEFKRMGDNLYATQEIDLYTAILGGEIYVNTLTG